MAQKFSVFQGYSPFAKKMTEINSLWSKNLIFYFILNFFILEKVSKYDSGEGSIPHYHKFVTNQ